MPKTVKQLDQLSAAGRREYRPFHVAVVMDGNGRWAKKRLLPRIAGHKRGVDSLRATVKACIDRDIRVLSVFAFSSENWNRPQEEVSGLMDLLGIALTREVPNLHEQGVQLHFLEIGASSILGLQRAFPKRRQPLRPIKSSS